MTSGHEKMKLKPQEWNTLCFRVCACIKNKIAATEQDENTKQWLVWQNPRVSRAKGAFPAENKRVHSR